PSSPRVRSRRARTFFRSLSKPAKRRSATRSTTHNRTIEVVTLRPRPLVIALGFAAIAAMSCYVQSIQPAYTAKTMAYDPELVGTWVSAVDEEYVFTLSDTASGWARLVGRAAG